MLVWNLDITLPLLKSNVNPQCRRSIAPLACRFEIIFSSQITLKLNETEDRGTLGLHNRAERRLTFEVNAETTSRCTKSVLIWRENLSTKIRTGAVPIYRGPSLELVFNMECIIRWHVSIQIIKIYLRAAIVILLIHRAKSEMCYRSNALTRC